ncbi:MAG: hypothetical protein KF857_04965 [Fimbriimonadaceae bacterium]|nr:hypothetical protein [Fimbriimonadaceae bacterium]
MATVADLRRIALSFPGVVAADGEQPGYNVMVKGKAKGIAWAWRERVHPKKPRVVNPEVYAVRTPNMMAKEMLVQEGAATGKFFTEPHYKNYPAILVRLELVDCDELREVFEQGYQSVLRK